MNYSIKKQAAFNLLEIVIMITILSIISIPVLNILITSKSSNSITYNEIDRVAKNTYNLFYSLLKQSLEDPAVAAYISNINIDCDNTQTSTDPANLLCKYSIGDNTRYTIVATTIDSSINIPVFGSNDIISMSYSIEFYTRNTASSAWTSYTSLNRTIEVLK